MVSQVLLDSAIDFCDSSLVLRQNLDSFSTTVGSSQYSLDAPSAQHDISRVMGVTLSGQELSAGMFEAIRNDLSTSNAKPRGFYTDRTNNVFTLELFPPPDGVYSVIVAVALRPKRTATSVDDDLFNMWIAPIISGAMARAMQIPDQPFSNPAQAQYLLDSAARQTNSARIDGNYGSVRGSMRVRARPFA
jgi:hypothetical protein